jgi:hypothetical protein
VEKSPARKERTSQPTRGTGFVFGAIMSGGLKTV